MRGAASAAAAVAVVVAVVLPFLAVERNLVSFARTALPEAAGAAAAPIEQTLLVEHDG